MDVMLAKSISSEVLERFSGTSAVADSDGGCLSDSVSVREGGSEVGSVRVGTGVMSDGALLWPVLSHLHGAVV